MHDSYHSREAAIKEWLKQIGASTWGGHFTLQGDTLDKAVEWFEKQLKDFEVFANKPSKSHEVILTIKSYNVSLTTKKDKLQLAEEFDSDGNWLIYYSNVGVMRLLNFDYPSDAAAATQMARYILISTDETEITFTHEDFQKWVEQ